MEEINLNSWEEFEQRLRTLQSEYGDQASLPTSTFLYRGQQHPKLSTTLERDGKERLPLKEYHRLMFEAKPEIESFTSTNWSILSYPEEIDAWLGKNQKNHVDIQVSFGKPEFQNTYSYMAYLRQHSFPSPLLDWTRSAYVAAFFAFRHALRCDRSVSIYVYLSKLPEASSQPFIHRFGPHVTTHPRHFMQQSSYTICFTYRNGQYEYAPHEEAFCRGGPVKPCVWKFNISAKEAERLKVLRILDGYNINAFSLFGSEDSLVETVALRQIHLQK
jgi:hypothetical protein